MKRNFAELLTKMRELELSQSAVARESGVCRSYVNRWLRGKIILKRHHVTAILKTINGHLAPWAAVSLSDYFSEEG